jgi:hypothetical protein
MFGNIYLKIHKNLQTGNKHQQIKNISLNFATRTIEQDFG